MEGAVSPKRYAQAASAFSYIAAPRGNGMDTHRFWESLYRGATPVVLPTQWSSNLKPHNIPFVEVDAWNGEALSKLVGETAIHPRVSAKEIPALWMSYWEKLIGTYI
jgi:hypothetical protein